VSARTADQGIPISSGRGYRRPVEFRVLGSIEVFEEGNGSIAIGGPKQRAVLAHLLLRANHLVPTEVLIDEVWGEEPPETARNALQSYTSHLRKALGAERLEGSRAGYRLRAEPSELDALRFQSLLRDARRLLPIDARAAVGVFDHALALWRGPAFADLATERSLRAEAAQLDELKLAALEDRIEAQLTIGNHGDVIGELEGLASRYPLRERFWEQLMLALYRSGRQGEALAAFQRARETLSDELGIDPSPELRRLHERILAQSPDLDASGEPLRGYRLLERLGEDAFGVLYRATQPNVGREVAVRVVHEHRANDPAFIRLFEAEAQAVATLENPHVVPVYDYWREPGRAHVVTRFQQGGSLRQLMDRPGGLSPERAIRILEQVASALTTAHRRGIAHGDLQPSNILFDEEGNAYLTDFSIGTGAVPMEDDIRAFAALTREALGERLPVGVDAALRRAETAQPPGQVMTLIPELVSALRTRGEVHSTVGVETRNPYKGLRPFLESDAGDFFGREALIERLLERLSRPDSAGRFIAVVGPSGSGKSSVVGAGLVAAIRRGAIPGSEGWFVTKMHPGYHPLEELDEALMRVAVRPPARLLARLESGPRGLVEVADVVVPEGTELLLVVDQFEELFTLTEDEDERALVLESLRVATADPASRVRVVATLRADFYDQPLRYPRIGQLMGTTTEVVSPLTPEELERAIVRPAERSGLKVESALVPQIAADVAERPGALPLVQYALTELYDRREDGRLTLDGYREIGGVGGALAASAEHLYATRHPVGREAVRQLFLRLVTLGKGTADTRLRVPLSELSAIEVDASAMDAAIDAYGRHRLITFDRDPASREPTVEIAHEALLSAWARLRDWIDDGREDVRMRRSLSEAAREWERSGQDPSFLLGGSRLDQFESWGSSTSLALRLEERGYLSASLGRRDEDRVGEAARRERERVLERRSVQRLRGLVAVFVVAALVAASLAVIAKRQSDRADRESRIATARELASAAAAKLEVDPQLALLLALEAVRTYGDDAAVPQAEEILRRAAPAVSIDTTLILRSRVRWVDFTDRGNAIALGGEDGSVGVWDLTNGSRRLALSLPSPELTCIDLYGECFPRRGIYTIDLSNDGSRLAIGDTGDDGEGEAHVWDVGSGREILTVTLPFSQRQSSPLVHSLVPEVALSPDGRLLATGHADGAVRIFDIATRRKLWSLRRSIWSRLLIFSPDGARLFFELPLGDRPARIANVGNGGTFTVADDRFWRAISAAGPRFAPRGGEGVAFSADSVATVTEGSDIRLVPRDEFRGLFDELGNPSLDPSDTSVILKGHTLIEALAFSEDGRLATGGSDGTIRVWNTSTQEVVYTSPVEPSAVVGVAFSADGSRVTAIYSDGRIIVYAIALEDVIEIARARLTRGFTDEECRTYLHVPTCPAE
jgi:DNA-binding SARP family transcriptional activator/WD40 repeat protein